MAGYSHQTWSCPFFTWDERLAVHCEGGRIRFPDWDARQAYTGQYCACEGLLTGFNANGWKRCTVARNLLRYYERTEGESPTE